MSTESTFGKAITLSLEEAFPTASPSQLADLRTQVIPSIGLRVVSIENGVMTLEGVRNPFKT